MAFFSYPVPSWSKASVMALLSLTLISEVICTQRSVVPRVKQSSPSRFTKSVGEEEVKLVCYVRNAQTYTWYKDGKQVTPTFEPARYTVKPDRYLRITDVVKSDSGLFVCVTANSYGSANCTIRFLVEDPTVPPDKNMTGGEKPQFLYPNLMKSVKLSYVEGTMLDLKCEARGVPSPIVTWYKDGAIYYGKSLQQHVTPGKYNYIISFGYVDINDQGTYLCIVSNSYGRLNYTYNISVSAQVRSPPLIFGVWEQEAPVHAGQNLNIFCKILTKDRHTKYRWFYSDSNIEDEDNLGVLIDPRLYEQPPYNGGKSSMGNVRFTLSLRNLTIDQSGLYWCQAENVAGNISRHTNLTVTYRPIVPVTTDTPQPNSVASQASGNGRAEKPGSWTSKIRYPGALIGVSVAVIIVLITVSFWFCWKIKKTKASPRPQIASLQPRYEVHNEYVVVPDFR